MKIGEIRAKAMGAKLDVVSSITRKQPMNYAEIQNAEQDFFEKLLG